MQERHESRAVLISNELYRRIEQRAMTTGFGSVEEYVKFILDEVVAEEVGLAGATFNEQDEEEVKKRLKDLGYM